MKLFECGGVSRSNLLTPEKFVQKRLVRLFFPLSDDNELFLSDEEFDRLKASLKASGSAVAVSKEPKCYIDTGICTVTFQVITDHRK